jgi:hypothetical protein
MSSSSEQELYVTMETVCKFLDATPKSRNFAEGERLLNSRHVISCDATKKTSSEVHLNAICLQTSSLVSLPHTVTGVLRISNAKVNITEMKCTCKAGESAKCKHIAGVLIFCTRLYKN